MKLDSDVEKNQRQVITAHCWHCDWQQWQDPTIMIPMIANHQWLMARGMMPLSSVTFPSLSVSFCQTNNLFSPSKLNEVSWIRVTVYLSLAPTGSWVILILGCLIYKLRMSFCSLTKYLPNRYSLSSILFVDPTYFLNQDMPVERGLSSQVTYSRLALWATPRLRFHSTLTKLVQSLGQGSIAEIYWLVKWVNNIAQEIANGFCEWVVDWNKWGLNMEGWVERDRND
jgi:hypothetical protein